MTRVSNRDAAGYIARKRVFTNYSKTMRGIHLRSQDLQDRLTMHYSSRMDSETKAQFLRDLDCHEMLYVVYSYDTPIGWTKLHGFENFTVPEEGYSPTTRRHQSILHRGVKEYEEKINA